VVTRDGQEFPQADIQDTLGFRVKAGIQGFQVILLVDTRGFPVDQDLVDTRGFRATQPADTRGSVGNPDTADFLGSLGIRGSADVPDFRGTVGSQELQGNQDLADFPEQVYPASLDLALADILATAARVGFPGSVGILDSVEYRATPGTAEPMSNLLLPPGKR
jgi:hypothetical protein